MQAASVLIVILGFTMFPLIVAPPEKAEVEGEEKEIEGLATEVGGMETEIGHVETENGHVEMENRRVKTEIAGEETEIEGQETKIEGEEKEFEGEQTEYETIKTTAETKKNETETPDDSTAVYYMKRNYGNGQKELQQVSDNITTRQQFVTSPRESVTVRTEQLLREAHGLLKDVNSNKKRFWLEAFAYFLEHMLTQVNPDRKLRKNNSSIEKFLHKLGAKEYKESIISHASPLVAINRKRKENYEQLFATVLPPVESRKEQGIPTNSKSMQSDYATFTYNPETATNIQNSPEIASLEKSNIQTSVPVPKSPNTDSQGLKDFRKFKDIYVPHESYNEGVSSNANAPQESSKAIETPEISILQEPSNEYPEAKENHQQSSSALPQSSEKDHYLPNVATPASTVPEVSQLQVVKLASTNEVKRPAQARAFPIIDSHISTLNGHNPSKYELVNNHLQEINYVDDLQRELMEVARLQALEKAPKNSSVSVTASDISPSTAINQRTSFLQEHIDDKPTQIDNLPRLFSLPQPTEDGPLTKSVTALYHAVPDVESHQVVQVASEAQPSVPRLKQSVPIQTEQEVTTTATLIAQSSNERHGYSEDDELVRELMELPRLVALERDRAQSTSTPSANPTDTLTPRTTKKNSFMTDNRNDKEEEKRNIEINLAQEIRELRQLGVKEEEIMKALGIHGLHLSGIQESEKIGHEAGIQFSGNINSEKTATYKINPNTWKPFTNPYTQQPYSNATFGGMHTNLPHMNVVANQYQGYRLRPYYPRMHVGPRNIQNMLHKLQRENYLLKKHLMTYTQANGNVNKLRGIINSGPNPLNTFLPHEVRYPTEFSLNPNIQSQRSIPVSHPYPYIMNSDLKNFTRKENVDKESPLIPKPLPQNTVSEFTDEMKRELRDGKVILLSDSVVRSNFDNEKKRDGVMKEDKVKSYSSDVGEAQVPAEN